MAEQNDDRQDVAKGLQAKAAPRAPRLMRAFAESTARVEFGLEAQGHIATIEKMLAAAKPWRVIAQAIGWSEDAAMEHFIEYLLRQRSAAEQAARAAGTWVPVSERLPEKGVFVIWRRDDGLAGEGYLSRYADEVKLSRHSVPLLLNRFTHWTLFPGEPSPVAGGPGAAERSKA